MKSKIELAPEKYWIEKVTIESAILYCFSLNIDGKTGWRLATRDEWFSTDSLRGWYVGKSTLYGDKFVIIPVRDI